MHALYVLTGLGALAQTHLLSALNDRDALVQEHAVRLAEDSLRRFYAQGAQSTGLKAISNPLLREKLLEMAADPDIRVRYQLAFTLGESKDPARIKTLAEIVRQGARDRWMRAAVLNSLKDGAGEIFGQLIGDARFQGSSGGAEFLQQLAGVIGTKNNSAEVEAVLNALANNADSDAGFLSVRGLGDGLRNAGTSLASVDTAGKLKSLFARAQTMAGDTRVSEQTRIRAIQLLALTRFDQAGETLSSVLGSAQAEPIQRAALDALGKFGDSRVSEAVLTNWQQLTTRVRGEAVAVMLTRSERTLALFKAIEQRTVSPSEITAQQLQMLRSHRDPNIREQANQLFGAKPTSRRDEVVKAFLPALQLGADPVNGKRIYLDRCATCHRFGSQGNAVGPDLMTVKTAGKATLLVNILDPDREVAPSYLNYTVETKAGESFSGLLAGESPSSLTLRGPNGTETVVLRAQIERLQPSGHSLMPEGLEAGLAPQDMADLLEYLVVADYSAR
jgi:putative heme-binding domain-containing protein